MTNPPPELRSQVRQLFAKYNQTKPLSRWVRLWRWLRETSAQRTTRLMIEHHRAALDSDESESRTAEEESEFSQ